MKKKKAKKARAEIMDAPPTIGKDEIVVDGNTNAKSLPPGPKRVAIFSDLHIGHRAGLCTPAYMNAEPGHTGLREELTGEFWRMVKAHGPFDLAVWTGDLVEGRGAKSGGTEVIIPDENEQAAVAAEIIGAVPAKKHLFAYGTPYHVGVDKDNEDLVVGLLGAAGYDVAIRERLWFDVNGKIFDCRHFTSNSAIPHGKFTPLAREWLWNLVWNDLKDRPKADIIVRSHIHSFDFCGKANWLAVVTPALQAAMTKLGRRLSCAVDFGMIWFDIESREAWDWNRDIVELVGEQV